MKTYAEELKARRQAAAAEVQRLEEVRKNYKPIEDDTLPVLPYRAPVQSTRLGIHDVPCLYCEGAIVKRGALVCPECRSRLTKLFGRFEDMPFHQELIESYRDVFLRGSGRSPLDKTGNTQNIALSEGFAPEVSNQEQVEPMPNFFMPGDASYWTAYKAIKNEVILALATGQSVPGRYKMHDILIEQYGFREKPAPMPKLIRRRKMVETTSKFHRNGVRVTRPELVDGVLVTITRVLDNVPVTKTELHEEEETVVIDFVPKGNYCPAIVTIQKYIEIAKTEVMSQADYKEWSGAYRMNGDELVRREFDELGEETLVVIARKPARLAEERKKRGRNAA